MTHKSLSSTIAAAIAAILISTGQGSATTCADGRAEHLKAQGATYFNLYYFSNVDDYSRCANLQSAIAYQQQFVAWIEACDPGQTRSALRDLRLYTSIPAGETGCAF